MPLGLFLFRTADILTLFSEAGSPCVAQAGLEVSILMPPHPMYSTYRHEPPCPAENFSLKEG